ncbi:MAG: YggT family protein [Micrococcales bacterium]
MPLLYSSLAFLCGAYICVLLARFFLDLVTSINRQFRPRGLLLVLCEVVFTLTDTPLKFMRKVIKPIRFGAVSLDLGWTILFLGLSFAQSLFMGLAAS